MSTFRPCLVLALFLTITAAAPQVGRADDPPAAATQTVTLELVIAEFTVPGKSDVIAGLGASDQTAAERLKQLSTQGVLSAVTRIRMATLADMESSIQMGEMVPLATGRTVAPFGGRGGNPERAGGAPAGGPTTMTQFSMHNVGTMVRATNKVENSGAVLTQLSIERSRIVPKAAAEGATEFEPQRTTQMQAKTNIRLPLGQSVLISGAKTFHQNETTELLIIATAQVGDAAAAPLPPVSAPKK